MLENYIKYLIKFLTALVLLTVLVAFTITVRNNLEVKKNDTKITNDRKKVNPDQTTTLKIDNETTNNTSNLNDNTDNKVKETINNTSTSLNNDSTTKIETVEKDNSDTDFSLNFNSKTLNVGDTAKIDVISKQDDLKIDYKVMNKEVATVSANGTIKALNSGSTYLNVVANNNTAKIIELVVLDNKKQEDVTEDTEVYQPSNDIIINDKIDNNQSTTTEKEEQKNGWITIDGKKYYYKDNIKITNSYIDYIYLDNNGIAKKKIGTFSATLYGATAWANQELNIRKEATMNSNIIGTIPVGSKMTILASENTNTKYIKVKYNNLIGYVYSNFILINLPDVIPDMLYEITSASKSTASTANTAIPGITGKNLYGFTKKYNSKIDKETYYVPLLYPTAKKLQRAYNKAKSEGYNLKVYDSYRPHDITISTNNYFRKLYNSNTKVKNAINYDKEGNYWGPSWFLASSVSAHNKGIALDITITNSDNQELKAQTAYDTLDTSSIVKYNNNVSNKLRTIMLSQGFSPLESEWWHFQDNDYKTSKVNTFHIK